MNSDFLVMVRKSFFKCLSSVTGAIVQHDLQCFRMGALCKQQKMYSALTYKEDRYKGIHVNLENDITSNEFAAVLKENLLKWRSNGATSVWLKVPIGKSVLIPDAAKNGFSFHHAEGQYSMLYQWLDKTVKERVPRFATHQIGVSGCVIKPDTKEVLVVRDRDRPYTMWKFPGGLSELGEDIGATAEREVFEETGVKSEFQGILAFRQQHNQPGAFGRSDLYFVCHMKPLTFDLSPCLHEIEACEWMGLSDLASNAQNSAITQRIVQLVTLGITQGFSAVHLSAESFQSVYKGKRYDLFCRTLPEGSKLTNYAHNVAESES